MTRCLAIAAKQPERGRVKTRLASVLGEDHAFELYRCALSDTLALASSIAGVARALAYAPPTVAAQKYFEQAAPTYALLPQKGFDLGERISHLFAELTQHFSPVVLIGSDSPDLPSALIERAFDLLRTDADVVLGPADDGGYYLIGINVMQPTLFERIDWSTAAVAQQTRARAESAGLRLVELPRWHDLDNVGDLQLLVAPGAPLTRAFVSLLNRNQETRRTSDEDQSSSRMEGR